jgi:hypothetical protein
MSYDYYSVMGEDGALKAVHAHKDHVPAGAVSITREEAVAISAARKTSVEPDAVTPNSDVTPILKAMLEEMAALKAELDAIKKTELVYEVKKS